MAEQGRFHESSGFLTFSDRKTTWLRTAAEPMHQYEVTEVNLSLPMFFFVCALYKHTRNYTMGRCCISWSLPSPSHVSTLY